MQHAQTRNSTNIEDLLSVVPVQAIPDNLEFVARETKPTESFADKIHNFNAELAIAQFELENTKNPKIIEVDDEILKKLIPHATLNPTFHLAYKGAILCTKNNKSTIENLLSKSP